MIVVEVLGEDDPTEGVSWLFEHLKLSMEIIKALSLAVVSL